MSAGLVATARADDGFYVGAGINTYSAREEVVSSDGRIDASHAQRSQHDGFLTQSLPEYGVGAAVGFRYALDTKTTNIFTIDAQYFFNHQNVALDSRFDDVSIQTEARYNHGYRLALGHRFGRVHPYIHASAIFQTIKPHVSSIDHGGRVHDVEDDGTILEGTLADSGSTFSTFVASFTGGIGLEMALPHRVSLNIEYTPMKHVEYGLRDRDEPDNYVVGNLVVNQLQIGARYYFFSPI